MIFFEDIKFNMSAIKSTMVGPETKFNWSDKYFESVYEQYRQFLFLVANYPNDSIVPSVEVDNLWHQHILDTQAYQNDCERVFGRFIHHNPYFGVGSEAAEQQLSVHFEETKKLIKEVFGSNSTVNEFSIPLDTITKKSSNNYKPICMDTDAECHSVEKHASSCAGNYPPPPPPLFAPPPASCAGNYPPPPPPLFRSNAVSPAQEAGDSNAASCAGNYPPPPPPLFAPPPASCAGNYPPPPPPLFVGNRNEANI